MFQQHLSHECVAHRQLRIQCSSSHHLRLLWTYDTMALRIASTGLRAFVLPGTVPSLQPLTSGRDVPSCPRSASARHHFQSAWQIRKSLLPSRPHRSVLGQHDFRVSTCLHRQYRGISSSCGTPTRRTSRDSRRTPGCLIWFPGLMASPLVTQGWGGHLSHHCQLVTPIKWRILPVRITGQQWCGPPSARNADQCSTGGSYAARSGSVKRSELRTLKASVEHTQLRYQSESVLPWPKGALRM